MKEYTTRDIKNNIIAFLTNFKKRYNLFPWSKVHKYRRLENGNIERIDIDGKFYSSNELLKLIDENKRFLKKNMRPTSYNDILREFKHSSLPNNQAYKNAISECEKRYYEMNDRLKKSMVYLKKLNSVIKTDLKNVRKESVEPMTLQQIIYNNAKEVYNYYEYARIRYESTYSTMLDDDLFFEANDDRILKTQVTKETRAYIKELRTNIKVIKSKIKSEDYAGARKLIASSKVVLNKWKKAIKHTNVENGFQALFLDILPLFIEMLGVSTLLISITFFAPVTGQILIGVTEILAYVVHLKGQINELEDESRNGEKASLAVLSGYRNQLYVVAKHYEKVLNNLDKYVSVAETNKKSGKHFEAPKVNKAGINNVFNQVKAGKMNPKEAGAKIKSFVKIPSVKKESYEDIDDFIYGYSNTSSRDKFNRVKEVLYERCAVGDISIEERENLLEDARNKYLFE
jgi:hypothetical protein